MYTTLIVSIQTINELLTAGIAISAFSLLLYALSFNLRDRVARSFALILVCVVFVFVGDTVAGIATTLASMEIWLRFQWLGIAFLPAAYLHLSDALLATTGRPSRGRRKVAVRLAYLLSGAFLVTLPFDLLVGHLAQNTTPAPYLERTWLTSVFTVYYLALMVLAGINFIRAYRRTHTRISRRRMTYLLVGALAPAIGSYPYLLFGSGFASLHPLSFWLVVALGNLAVTVLLVTMAYAAAFFGVSWPDRVVKRRLFKWLMRGPITASTILAVTTLARRVGERFGESYTAFVPIIMVASLLILEHLITLVAPFWERWLFHGSDSKDIELLQKLEERLLTSGDLRQFLESVLAAVCDRLQVSTGFIVTFSRSEPNMLVTIGEENIFEKEEPNKLLAEVTSNGKHEALFLWGDYWLVPLFAQNDENKEMLGLLGAIRHDSQEMDGEQRDALGVLADRAAQALEDRQFQNQVFSSLEVLTPEMERIQRWRAAARYDETSLTQTSPAYGESEEQGKFIKWVKDALTHYWGGPKLTQSPLLRLRIVQEALQEHRDNPTNALRSILRQAIEHVRPEGERRFTGEWILFNILELKFMEGRSVREVAMRLAMSEADLYRKQRVAIEAVTAAIMEMENNITVENSSAIRDNAYQS